MTDLPPYTRTPVTLPDGTPVIGWSEPPPAACKCSHSQSQHGSDRSKRSTCFGSVVCGCTTFRPKETEK